MEKLLAILPERPQPVFVRYGVTAAITAICCAIQLAIYAYAGFTAFFILLPGIFLCGILFDRGSAVVATLLGAGLSAYLSPIGDNPRHIAPLSLFIAIGFATAVVSEGLRKTMERLVAAERTKDVLLRELDHRIKNNMMSMASLLRIQARASSSDETKVALASASRRIRVMADLHDFLRPSGADRLVDMAAYLSELFSKMEDFQANASISLKVNTENIDLPESRALPIAIILNELVTNSLKHAFPGERPGKVEVSVRNDGALVIEVRDNGVGCPETAKPGIGSRLVQLMTQQLGGTLVRTAADPGCRTTVKIPTPVAGVL